MAEIRLNTTECELIINTECTDHKYLVNNSYVWGTGHLEKTIGGYMHTIKVIDGKEYGVVGRKGDKWAIYEYDAQANTFYSNWGYRDCKKADAIEALRDYFKGEYRMCQL